MICVISSLYWVKIRKTQTRLVPEMNEPRLTKAYCWTLSPNIWVTYLNKPARFSQLLLYYLSTHMRLTTAPKSLFELYCHISHGGNGGKWKKVNHIWYYVSCCSNLSIPFIFLSVCHMNMCEHRLKHCKSYAAVFSPFTQCICVPWCLYS